MNYFVYLDAIPEQRSPLIYATSNEGQGYPGNGTDGFVESGLVYQFSGESGGETFEWGPYRTADSATGGSYYNSRGFQIISPGFDGLYGDGGVVADGELRVPNGFTAADGRSLQAGQDNITNFSEGMLAE